MKKLYLSLFSITMFSVAGAQVITSITSGSWHSPATWSPAAVPGCSDSVFINNTHTISVSSAGNTANTLNIQIGGALTVSAGSLTIGCTFNNKLLTNEGTLTLTGGVLQVNGGLNISDNSFFNMSGGTLNIDPNDGTEPGSYSSTNGIFYINTSKLNVTGGNINLQDPPYMPGQRILAYDTNVNDTTFGTGNTVTIGGGTHTNPANLNGFYIESNVTGGTLEIGTLTVNGGRYSGQRHLSTNEISGFITRIRNLTVNAGSEAVIDASMLAITGNIVNNGFITSLNSLSAALSMVGNAFFSGGIAIEPSATAQSITGSGYFKKDAADADAVAQTGNLLYSFTNYHTAASPGLTLGMPLTIYGTLRLADGKINTTAVNFLALGTGTSLPGYVTPLVATAGTLQNFKVTTPTTTVLYPQGGWATGPFKRYFLPAITPGNAGIMPVGSDTSRPAQILFTVSPSGGGYLVAQWSDANGGTNGLPLNEPAVTPSTIDRVVNGIWSVVNEGITGGRYTATFTNTRAQGILNFTKTTLLKRANAGAPWTLQGNHVTTTGGNTRPTVKRTNLMGFSEFAIGANVTVLPVSVEYFRGSKLAAANYLDWKVTCTNEPSVTIILERSADGRTFSTLQNQTATALRCEQPFNYTDLSPLAGINYYRLRIVTADGAFKYSSIVALLNRAKGFELISLSPNPVSANTVLTLTSVKSGRMDLSVTDATGKLISRQSVNVIAGNNIIPLHFTGYSTGTYNVQVRNNENEHRMIRAVKL